jgi:Arc/MetJ-type ribon-helix-helix transcriptional regulator
VAATVEKVSVALGLEDLAWLRERAEQQRASLSAVLTAAIRATREREALRERQRASLETYVTWATDGEGLPAEVVAEAERELDELAAK